MFNLSELEFNELKNCGKVFPVCLEFDGNKVAPIEIYHRLKGRKKFILETINSEREIGGFSFIGSDPYVEIMSYGEKVTVIEGSVSKVYYGKILDYLKIYMNFQYDTLGIEVDFLGGAVGYVGYDVIRQYEKLPNSNNSFIDIPEAYLMFYKTIICYDHSKDKVYLVYNVFLEDKDSYKSIKEKLKNLETMLLKHSNISEVKKTDIDKEYESNYTKEKFCSMVEKAKEYIKAGDIFQVVLSQRLKIKSNSDSFQVYRRLRTKNPSPYLFYIDFENFQVVGSSPESLIKVKGEKIVTNPIAGTRPRGKNKEEDLKFKEELLSDEKEVAEHLMLVDLGRNDLGRISEFGTVKLERFLEVDLYSHVMHIVSLVSGKLKGHIDCFQGLSTCLPVGTVSGAPKIRAMEIIDELEDSKRGLYAGAVGYFSYNKDMDTAIAIRTIVFKDGYGYVQAGAGIVYDSVPEKEYMETINKAMTLLEVL